MIFLEDICHRTTCVGAKVYVNELETRLNNGIFREE